MNGLSASLQESLISIAVAIAAGLLIGSERQQAHGGREAADFGGIRTFPLVALIGALGALMKDALGSWTLPVLFLGVIALLLVTHARSKDDLGVSSEVAAIVTFALGAISATPEILPAGQRYLLVAGAAATTMALLALKRPLHGFIARVSEGDVYATAKFVLLALVVLPLLPNRNLGPLEVFNPFKIGLMIVLVAGISFAGYVATRTVGARKGFLVAAILGGLVSSTAVTLTFSGRARETPGLVRLSTVAILAASAMMFLRVLAVIAMVDAPLLVSVSPALGTMAVVGLIVAVVLYKKSSQEIASADPVQLRNPFELKQAVQFGLLYAAVLFIAKATQVYVGNKGLYISAVLAGLADVDAITLSLIELHRSGLEANIAATGTALAAFSNTGVKGVISAFVGGTALGRQVGIALAIVVVAGIGGWAISVV